MKKADLLLKNASVYSIGTDGKRTKAETVAVAEGVIAAIGSEAETKEYIGDETQIIDCGGNTVLPGLCDAHCHASYSASAYAGCDLFGIYIQEDETDEDIIRKYLDRLKKFVDEHPDNEMIRGTGWVEANFNKGRYPNRHDIDKICNDRPVVLEAFSQHTLWVNTKALEAAGIDENTPDVKTGAFWREESGYPNGIFKEAEAMSLVKEGVPGYDYTVEQYKDSLLYYQREYANKYGVTLIQDCWHSDNAREAYKQLAEEGRLTIRARGVYFLEPGNSDADLAAYIERKGQDDVDDLFKIETIKTFAEGTFAMCEPYCEEFLKVNDLPEDYNGPLFWKDDKLTEAVRKTMEAGMDLHIHAMGDLSVKQSVKCIAAGQDAAGRTGRNVVAHLMLIKPEDVRLMGQQNIIGNCQPRWMVYDSDIKSMFDLIGEKRSLQAYPYRTFLDNDITVAFGTDFPVTPPPDTMHEIQCAMTRSVFPDAPDYRQFKGKVLGDEKPAALEEAVQSLSINGAYQMNLEDVTGSIEVGKSAEFAILDSNIEKTSIDEIYAIKVAKTIFKGKVVYENEKGGK
ncbi:amidohydrolase [Anaerovorax odorimutans]|uniref:Amidohydrolase n=1 Tax=Anaerovorax odorimutans TaxID=109327 RepID=A0ABT1RPY4_9FIRM|nr:amidohydrolase [Anaerovorax odorimutans]MCQ4637224.1 amidohydrolase [Anaerovorax odorimutans]